MVSGTVVNGVAVITGVRQTLDVQECVLADDDSLRRPEVLVKRQPLPSLKRELLGCSWQTLTYKESKKPQRRANSTPHILNTEL